MEFILVLLKRFLQQPIAFQRKPVEICRNIIFGPFIHTNFEFNIYLCGGLI